MEVIFPAGGMVDWPAAELGSIGEYGGGKPHHSEVMDEQRHVKSANQNMHDDNECTSVTI